MNNSKVLETIMSMAKDNNQGLRMSTALIDAKKDPRGGIVSFGVEKQDLEDASLQLLGFPNKNMICCFFIDRQEFEKYNNPLAEKEALPNYAGTFRTYSGKIVNILNPDPGMIDLTDISKGLSYNAHFTGQTPQFFSIAEHCLLTADLVMKQYPEDYELILIALLHDAAEAYIGDMIHPIKLLFPEFKAMENKLLSVIFDKFDLPIERLPEVKPFYLQAQDMEASEFYISPSDWPGKGIYYHSPESVYRLFKNSVIEHLKIYNSKPIND